MRRAIARLLTLFRHQGAERELAREMAAHLSLIEDDLREKGMSATEARLVARRRLSGVELTKERHRDMRSFRVDDLLQDLRYACRGLRRAPV